MKQKLLPLLFASAFILGACGGETANTDNGQGMNDDIREETGNEENNDGKVEVDKKLVNVEITLPASFLELESDEEIDIDEIKQEAEQNGIKDVELNNDGSVTYTMSKSTHRELLTEMEEAIEETIEEVINDEDFTSIKDIQSNTTYDKYEIIVDKERYKNSFDGIGVLGVAFSSMYYQLFEGVNPNDYEVIVDLIDEETGDVFETLVYPDVLDEIDEE